MGVDSKLTEKKIMKLANLIKEFAPTTEEVNKPKWLEALKDYLKTWKRKEYKDDKHRGEEYYLDIQGLVEMWESTLEEEKEKAAYDKTNRMVSEDKNSKIRSLIRKTIRK